MSIEAIGAIGAQEPAVNLYAPAQSAQKSQETSKTKDNENPKIELTTITTNCPKKHEHGPQCPHTVSTVPVPEAKKGEPGSLFNKKA